MIERNNQTPKTECIHRGMRRQTRKQQKQKRVGPVAVAVFRDGPVEGTAVASFAGSGTCLRVEFSKLPKGKHGFHIHRAGDLRGKGCLGACDHFHVGRPCRHGAGPTRRSHRPRHSGDLGNLPSATPQHPFRRTYWLPDFPPQALWGRSLIVHEKEDDLGLGPHEDSGTTGHSGARIACALFGRICE
jgi:Cu-Zn family superoxide dismutase